MDKLPLTSFLKKKREAPNYEELVNMLKGKDGDDGVSVVSAKVVEGNLIITLSNGKEINAGYVKGEDGEDGEDGDDGKDAVAQEPNIAEIAEAVAELMPQVDEEAIVQKVKKSVKNVSAEEIAEQLKENGFTLKTSSIEGLDEWLEAHKKQLRDETTNSIRRNIQQRGGPTQFLIKSAGTPVARVDSINFVNATVAATGDGTNVDVTTTGGGGGVSSVSSSDASITVTNPTTTPNLSVVSAPKWTTARTLAGNSVDGSANVPFANKFIAQGTSDTGLTNAQFLGSLGTGIVKNTTTTGVLSIAVAGDFPTLNQNTTGTASNLSGTPALPNGTTATTQSSGDNSTKLATTAYADAAAAKGLTTGHGFTISGTISTGKTKGYYTHPVAATLVGWNIFVNAGTMTVRVWKVAAGTAVPTVSNNINTSGVSISTGTAIQSSTMSDFTTTSVAANDIFAFEITAVSGVSEATFELVFKNS